MLGPSSIHPSKMLGKVGPSSIHPSKMLGKVAPSSILPSKMLGKVGASSSKMLGKVGPSSYIAETIGPEFYSYTSYKVTKAKEWFKLRGVPLSYRCRSTLNCSNGLSTSPRGTQGPLPSLSLLKPPPPPPPPPPSGLRASPWREGGVVACETIMKSTKVLTLGANKCCCACASLRMCTC